MRDPSPFLFVHLPLDELMGDRLLDASRNRRDATAHGAAIANDDVFGHCLQLSGGEDSYVEFPPWKLEPLDFAPPGATHQKIQAPPKFTLSMWFEPGAGEAEMTLADVGFGPDLQRLKVRFKRSGAKVSFTVVAPAFHQRKAGYRWTAETAAPAGGWVHFGLLWDPRGDGVNEGRGLCRMLLNGKPFDSSSKTDGEAPSTLTGRASFQTYLGGPSFSGRLAHFRLYTRELSPEDVAWDMENDPVPDHRFRFANAVDCSLEDPNRQPMLYLSASDIGEKMTFLVKPRRNGIAPVNPPRGPVGVDSCHFELAFRPGTLDLTGNRKITVSPGDDSGAWVAAPSVGPRPDGHDSVFIRCNAQEPFPAGGLQLVLNALKADTRFGPRSTLVDIRYRNLRDDKGEVLSGSVQQRLNLVFRDPATTLDPIPPRIGLGWLTDNAEPLVPFMDGQGQIRLTGHFFCPSALDQVRENSWQTVAYLTSDFAPFGGKQMRFPGRVRWQSPVGPPALATLWWSDLIVGPDGVVSIATDFPMEVRAAGRVDVMLNGVSYLGVNLSAGR